MLLVILICACIAFMWYVSCEVLRSWKKLERWSPLISVVRTLGLFVVMVVVPISRDCLLRYFGGES